MHRQRLAVSVLALAALLALPACGTVTGSGSAGSDGLGPSTGSGSGSGASGPPLTGTRWGVESVTVGGQRSAAPAGAHVEIGADGRASGNYGCNRFTAEVRLDGDTLTVGPGTTTEMGCEQDIRRFETLLSRAFSGKLTAAATDSDLTLTTVNGDTVSLTARPPAPLTGTRWRITTLVSGSTASSLPAGTEDQAHFTFGEDGTVHGTLGCNSFRGTAEVSGSTVVFGPLVTTRKMCPDPGMRLERALLAVLDGKRTAYRLAHRTLTLTAQDGKGIAASAPAEEEEEAQRVR
ncbi:META domain-containing protein [Streptomyces sp. NPDC002809]|uniref:META domain-containing protein n=1 Tax=Streptomyces sp. NPDC002809 TaxID=3154433 RepID=UPI00331A1DD7